MFIDRFIFQKHLEEGETVLFAAHKSWSQLLPAIFKIVFFGFILPFVFYYAGFRSSLYALILFFWMLFGVFRLIHAWMDWYSDLWLFTDMSIIVVEWHGIFSNTSQRISYEDAEGISFIILGFWGAVLRFGDVTLKTLSGSQITLKNAAHPKKVELALMKHQSNYMAHRERSHSDGLKELLSQMVAHHLRKQ